MGELKDPGGSQQHRVPGDPSQLPPVSPMRALLAVVPLLVILVFGSNLLGFWSTPGQHAARVEQQEASARATEAARREAQADRERAGRLESTAQHSPQSERSAEPNAWLKDALERFERLGQRNEQPSGGDRMGPPLFGPPPFPDTQIPPRPFDPAIVVALLPRADIENGAQSFRMCRACHANEKGASSFIGPNLWGIVGRPKASALDFGYSAALVGLGGTWTAGELAAFINNPRSFAPGTSMAYAGMSNPLRLANLIAYLATLTDAPPPPAVN